VKLVGPAPQNSGGVAEVGRLRDADDELPRMGFFEHLEEFRRRLIASLVALAAAFGIAWSRSSAG
jgi:hypothetical protein